MHVPRVRPSVELKFKGKLVFVSRVLAGERVPLFESDDGTWSIALYKTLLGRLDERSLKITPG